jgi:hypothetical protein
LGAFWHLNAYPRVESTEGGGQGEGAPPTERERQGSGNEAAILQTLDERSGALGLAHASPGTALHSTLLRCRSH